MSSSLLSRPSTFSRLTGLWCSGLRWSLLYLNLSLQVFRFACWRLRFSAIIAEEREGGEAPVKRQHHLASFDLADLPSIDLIADLCAYQFLVGARANDSAGALAIHHHTEENQIGRWRWRCRRLGSLHGRHRCRRRRRWTTGRRTQRTIEYR